MIFSLAASLDLNWGKFFNENLVEILGFQLRDPTFGRKVESGHKFSEQILLSDQNRDPLAEI